MKKSLSLLVAIAMVFSVFASMASAAELTAQQKFDALKEAGIFEGYPDGTAGLNKEMTRAEFSKVLALVNGLTQEASAGNYTDVAKGHWAAGFIGAVTKAGLMEGVGLNKFNPNGKVTVEQMAKTVVLSAGLEESSAAVQGTVSDWAKGYVAAAVEAGIIPAQSSYKANATRELLVEASYVVVNGAVSVQSAVVVDDKNIEVTFTDGTVVKKALETALVPGQATKVTVEHNGQSYEVTVTLGALSIAKAEQTDARQITVSFNRALSATEKAALTYEVKSGQVTYNVSPTWSEDNKSVVLNSTFLPANDYVVTVKGFDPVNVKVEDAKATKIEIQANSIQKAANQELGVKVFNQFNKEIENASVNVTLYNATQQKEIPASSGVGTKAKYNLSADTTAKIDDVVVVTAALNGLYATKNFKVTAASAATSIDLGTVAPLKDKTRITGGDAGLVVPVELTDQYGAKIKLNEKTKEPLNGAQSFGISGITFTVSPANVVTHYAVSDKGVLTIDTAAVAVNTPLVISAVNYATGAHDTTTVTVSAPAVVKTLQLSSPNTVVVAGEDVVLPFTAVDTFGNQVKGSDIVLGNGNTELNITSTPIAITKKYVNSKGELVLTFASAGYTNLYAYVGPAQVGYIGGLKVEEPSKPVKINGVKDVQTTIATGAAVDFDTDNITYIDSYSRTKNVTAGVYTVEVEKPAVVTYTNGQLVAQAEGSSKVTITYNGVADSAYSFTVNVVKAADVKNFEIKKIDTIYGGKIAGNALTAASDYAVTVEVIGKLNGADVAINQANAFNQVTTSDQTVVAVQGNKIYGLKAGTATISVYDGATKLGEQVVTVSEAAPVATKVELDKTDYSIVGQNGTATVKVTVKDQYGVVITPNGDLFSDNKEAVTVSGSGATFTVTAQKSVGSANLTYRTSNGVTATASVSINPTA